MNYIQREHNEEDGTLWKFRRIMAHQGPLTHRHPNYKNSMYNVCIEWENGETTYKPLAKTIADDPITLTLYTKENNLLNVPGWKSLKKHAKREKKLIRLINQVIPNIT